MGLQGSAPYITANMLATVATLAAVGFGIKAVYDYWKQKDYKPYGAIASIFGGIALYAGGYHNAAAPLLLPSLKFSWDWLGFSSSKIKIKKLTNNPKGNPKDNPKDNPLDADYFSTDIKKFIEDPTANPLNDDMFRRVTIHNAAQFKSNHTAQMTGEQIKMMNSFIIAQMLRNPSLNLSKEQLKAIDYKKMNRFPFPIDEKYVPLLPRNAIQWLLEDEKIHPNQKNALKDVTWDQILDVMLSVNEETFNNYPNRAFLSDDVKHNIHEMRKQKNTIDHDINDFFNNLSAPTYKKFTIHHIRALKPYCKQNNIGNIGQRDNSNLSPLTNIVKNIFWDEDNVEQIITALEEEYPEDVEQIRALENIEKFIKDSKYPLQESDCRFFNFKHLYFFQPENIHKIQSDVLLALPPGIIRDLLSIKKTLSKDQLELIDYNVLKLVEENSPGSTEKIHEKNLPFLPQSAIQYLLEKKDTTLLTNDSFKHISADQVREVRNKVGRENFTLKKYPNIELLSDEAKSVEKEAVEAHKAHPMDPHPPIPSNLGKHPSSSHGGPSAALSPGQAKADLESFITSPEKFNKRFTREHFDAFTGLEEELLDHIIALHVEEIIKNIFLHNELHEAEDITHRFMKKFPQSHVYENVIKNRRIIEAGIKNRRFDFDTFNIQDLKKDDFVRAGKAVVQKIDADFIAGISTGAMRALLSDKEIELLLSKEQLETLSIKDLETNGGKKGNIRAEYILLLRPSEIKYLLETKDTTLLTNDSFKHISADQVRQVKRMVGRRSLTPENYPNIELLSDPAKSAINDDEKAGGGSSPLKESDEAKNAINGDKKAGGGSSPLKDLSADPDVLTSEQATEKKHTYKGKIHDSCSYTDIGLFVDNINSSSCNMDYYDIEKLTIIFKNINYDQFSFIRREKLDFFNNQFAEKINSNIKNFINHRKAIYAFLDNSRKELGENVVGYVMPHDTENEKFSQSHIDVLSKTTHRLDLRTIEALIAQKKKKNFSLESIFQYLRKDHALKIAENRDMTDWIERACSDKEKELFFTDIVKNKMKEVEECSKKEAESKRKKEEELI